MKKLKLKKDVKNKKYEWNLKLMYSSLSDPQIERDVIILEKIYEDFSLKWNTIDKEYLYDNAKLLESLGEFENIIKNRFPKPLLYLNYITSIDNENNRAVSLSNLLNNRLTKAANAITFFEIALGKIKEERQKEILGNKDFAKYHFFLACIFDDASHMLAEGEEKIMNLKSLTSREMWNDSHDKILSSLVIEWKGKTLPISQISNMIQDANFADRKKLSQKMNEALKKISAFSEAEINAVITDKKINDELRGYKTSYESVVRHYRNDPKVVDKLVDIVSKNFSVSHKFYKIKAKLLKQKNLNYFDRGAKIGEIKGNFSFESSIKILEKVFGDFDKKYSKILNSFIQNGQIDVYPRRGKRSGAFCSSSDVSPTFVLLNDIGSLASFTTFAHEMGHAFHSELTGEYEPSIYSSYSMSLAEVASTFFETLAFDEVVNALPKKEQAIALHNRISDDIATIFRQIACFNLQKEMHEIIRTRGFLPKEELALLHNKHMKSYLGPLFKMNPDDGYFFVMWGHLRWFYYVYSYAYGQLVSKALLRKYREDRNFITNIENYLKAGGKDTPENILKEIGLDVTTGKVFEEGIEEIKKDIKRLEGMIRSKK